MSKHWKKIPANDRAQYRNRLLQGTLQEEDQLVRHGASRVVTAIAKIDLENGEWLDIFDVLLRAAGSQNEREREVGTYLLFSALESMGEAMMQRFPEMLSIFAKTISKFVSHYKMTLSKPHQMIHKAPRFASTPCWP